MKHSDIDRFRSKVAAEPDENGCLIWLAGQSNGYGVFRLNGTTVKAHRIAWEIQNGPIPKGLCCCHSCDVPWCVNVDHLFVGTVQDNVDDMVAKLRGRNGNLRGEHIAHAILTEREAQEIKWLTFEGHHTLREIGEMSQVRAPLPSHQVRLLVVGIFN